jgi:hypothetical protein
LLSQADRHGADACASSRDLHRVELRQIRAEFTALRLGRLADRTCQCIDRIAQLGDYPVMAAAGVHLQQ